MVVADFWLKSRTKLDRPDFRKVDGCAVAGHHGRCCLRREDRAIKELTRDDIANAKVWEQRRLAASEIRRTREEWQKTILQEINFKAKLAEKIRDTEVRQEAEKGLERAIGDLVKAELMVTVEHVPRMSLDLLEVQKIRPHLAL